MIYVVATLTIKPGSLEALRAPAAACVAETLKEKGCNAYELFESVADPQKLVFVEKWETREDLTAHSKQPHLAAWREASNPHLVSRSIEIVHPEKVETF
ncbi:antibiotic biosynthesis monooxygenase [Aquibium carbonis]|uniref:Antibiotic biosynthesis monooxygenase n=1 Tax=Aquibium carbonis TaxID=2495581 RepID=A0A3R9YGQ9_9HYPH|nr:putative quinol monooxygenase [Aquibium carbonis]RST87249.1 antibiotic biosynthesis monooxygenase [Aquibium carbonis]